MTPDLGPRVLSVGVEPGSDFDVLRWRERWRSGDVPDQSPYGLERMAAFGIRVHTLGESGRKRAALDGGLQRVLARTRIDPVTFTRSLAGIDVLLTMHEKRGVPAVLAAGARGVPVLSGVVWLAGADDVPKAAFAALTRILRGAAGLFVHSEAQIPIVRSWGVRPSRVHYVRFGVNTDWWMPGGSVDPDLLVAAGTDRDRDYPTLLRAFGEVRRQRPASRLVVAGPLGLAATEGATLPGPLPHGELRDLYRRAAVVVIPTRRNHHVSGSTSSLEAMSCGRPLVTMDTPGFRDYVQPGHTGELVPYGDPQSLAATLVALLSDPDRSASLGHAARERVRTGFTHDILASQLAALVHSIA